MPISREIRLARRPVGLPVADDFELAETDVAAPEDGEVQVTNLVMSVDPYMRGRMIDRRSYAPSWEVGEILQGHAVGRVVVSNHRGFLPGDVVSSVRGWREAFVAPGSDLENLGRLRQPASAYLGVLGMPGLTAYAGLLEVGALAAGDIVFVSGAAGAVGSAAGQIARLNGAARVIGSAGTDEKVRWLIDVAGFDAAFNYRDFDGADAIGEHLATLSPEGIDLYFDNVGGDHLQAALASMRPMGRIALCGAIANYNNTEPAPGPSNLSNAIGMGLTLRGFIVTQFQHLAPRFRRDMEGWITNGELHYTETVVEGIEAAPSAFIGLFSGANTGKMVVRLADDEA